MSIPIFRDVEEARASVLRRVPFDDVRIPDHVAERIREVFGEPLSPVEAVQQILDDVRRLGDSALEDYTRRLDGVAVTQTLVTEEEMGQAWEDTPAKLRDSLQLAAERIGEFHSTQKEKQAKSWFDDAHGGRLGQVVRPLARVGVYVPGGTAAYPSSVLMAAVPARVAGVPEVVVTTPPNREGRVHPAVLAAARIANVTGVYKVGGAQAIAALAYGTETIPRVDKVVGPGNLFVVLAKRLLYGQVGIDGLPGPTETLIVADDTARPHLIAADLIAQAEHDVLASAILLTPSEDLAERTRVEAAGQLEDFPRKDIAIESFERRGGIVLTESISQAIELANEYAPEHLCLVVQDPASLIDEVHNAGGIFLGETSSEALGDYVVGPSHIMPTGGTARFASAVNVLDFVKVINVFGIGEREAASMSHAAAGIAESEGLVGHARAVRYRTAGPGAS